MSMPRNMTIGFGCAQPTQALADAYDAEGDVIRKKTTLLSTEEAIEIETAAKGDVAPVTETERAGTIANYILRPDKERRTGEITNPRTSGLSASRRYI